MERILVAGVDTVVGANMAAHLADKYNVVGQSVTASISIEGCETVLAATDDLETIRDLVASFRPDRIVICGVAGDSPWHRTGSQTAQPGAVASARLWSRVASELDVSLTLISSDGIFSGPWMFHTENSTAFCDTPSAKNLRSLEASTLSDSPGALVIRTHAYGWSPLSDRLGWIEGILAALQSDRPGIFDCMAHSTPILATDLADVLHGAWEARLTGVYHVAGAERVNPHRFVRALAGIFELSPPYATILSPPDAVQTGFSQGETSLHTRAIRRALGIPMPMLADGLQRLRDQQNGGFDRQFRGSRRATPSKVA